MSIIHEPFHFFPVIERRPHDRHAHAASPEEATQSSGVPRRGADALPDYAIFVVDPAGAVVSWNAGAERLEGYTSAEITGRDMSVFFLPADREAGVPARALAEAAQLGRHESDGICVRKDGSRFRAHVVLSAIRDASGDLLGFASITRNIGQPASREAAAAASPPVADARPGSATSDRERELQALRERVRGLAAELERRRGEAEAANRAKREFLMAMSHELRTPLNAIGGYAELLEMELRGPLTPAQRADIQRIRESQQQLLGIINDLLNFTRVEAGQVAYDIEDFPLADAIATVGAMLEPHVRARDMTYTVDACVPAVIARADREKVEQILLNLLSNALKYTAPGGTLTWTCHAAGSMVLATLADTGQGIPAHRLGDIFDPFVQIGRSFAQRNDGAGLGLAISRDLARAMGGDLTVESALGKGSTFTLHLPRAGGGHRTR